MELKSRVQITASNMLIDSIFSKQQSSALVVKVTLPSGDGTGNQQPASTPGGNQQTIQTISQVQQRANPTDTNRKQQPQSAINTSDFPYLYLYPGKVDYANVGISPMKLGVAGNGTATTFVQDFRLYDVTRRALNCLTLLWTAPKEALDPATIECFQKMLVPRVLSVPPATTATDGATTGNDQPALDAKSCDALPVPEAAEVKDAIKALSSLVIRLLEAWDSFLRASFYQTAP